jgi:hypothetical protein
MLSKQSTTQFCSLEKSLLFFSQFLLCQEIFTKTAFNLSKLALIGAYEEERIALIIFFALMFSLLSGAKAVQFDYGEFEGLPYILHL